MCKINQFGDADHRLLQHGIFCCIVGGGFVLTHDGLCDLSTRLDNQITGLLHS
jgi:hypothetical protein